MKSLRWESILMMMALIDGSHSTSIPETMSIYTILELGKERRYL